MILRIYLFSITLFLTGLFGCKKFVEIPPPLNKMASTSVFNDNSTATAAQTAIYASMFNDQSVFKIQLYSGLSGDELTNYSGVLIQKDLFSNKLSVINDAGQIEPSWKTPYNYIYQANAIIEGIQNSLSINDAVKKQLIGEAKFMRAFWHFYLTNLFGPVPIITKTNYTLNAIVSNSSQEEVYKQAIADLKDAQSLLNADFVDASDTLITTERVRPTQSAARALLARIYLYIGDWSNAEAQASLVIGNSALFNLVSLDEVFLMNSNEAIWQLQASPTAFYTQDGNFFILKTAPARGGFRIALSNQLVNSFEPGDNRKISWVGSYKDMPSGTFYYYPHKYKANNTSSSISEYQMVLRLAEQYLIRAEARAKQGNIDGAQSDLNRIRNRAGLTDIVTSDQQFLLNSILHERQVELFTEWGNRWFDLKRTGSIDSVMKIVTPQKGGDSWNSYQQFYPIPVTDIQNNINLKQTPGY